MKTLFCIAMFVGLVAAAQFVPGRSASFRAVAAEAGCDTQKDYNTDTTGHAALTIGNNNGTTWRATKFTAGSSYSVCKVEFLLGKLGGTGLPTGNVFAQVWSDSSNPGTLLATSDAVDAASLPTLGTSNYVAFTFPSSASLASGTVYWVGLTVTNISVTSYVGWWRPNAFVSGGVLISTNGTVWNTGASVRSNFKTYSQ